MKKEIGELKHQEELRTKADADPNDNRSGKEVEEAKVANKRDEKMKVKL